MIADSPPTPGGITLAQVDFDNLFGLLKLCTDFLYAKTPPVMAFALNCEEEHARKIREAVLHNLLASYLCLQSCRDQG